MMKRVALSICWLIGLLPGCTEVVSIELPPVGNTLVVNSFYTPDSSWTFQISALVDPLSDSLGYPLQVPVEIALWADGTPVALSVVQDSVFYRTDYYPEPHVQYTVRISAPGFREVRAETSIEPDQVPYSVRAQEAERIVLGGYEVYPFLLTLQDPPSENYYAFSVLGQGDFISPYGGDTVQGGLYNVPMSTNVEDQSFYNWAPASYLISDALFNGEEFSITFGLRDDNRITNGDISTGPWWQPGVVYCFRLCEVSSDYYKFTETHYWQGQAESTPFTQPSEVYSNVEGGFGIIAGYTCSCQTLEP